MKAMWGIAAGLAAAVGLLAATSNAAVKVPAGDTCSATGSGTSYQISIILGPNAPTQAGFAVGAPGGTVTSLQDENGDMSAATNLPTGTNLSVMLNTTMAVPGGTVPLTVKTSGPISKAFTVVPYDQTHSTWFDALTCGVSKAVTPSSKFTVQSRFSYGTAAGGWSFFVTLPGAGKVNVTQGGGKTLLLKSTRAIVSHAGKLKVTVRPTAAGNKALATSGSLKARLTVEFSPTGGKPANKSLTVTLRK